MITGDNKNQIDRMWTTFWNNGISNPVLVNVQSSHLLLIKRLGGLQLPRRATMEVQEARTRFRVTGGLVAVGQDGRVEG